MGQTLKEVISFGAEAAQRLSEVENRDALLVELKAKQEQDAAAYQKAALQLTALRSDAAKRLEKLAEAQINDLAMNTPLSCSGGGGKVFGKLDRAWLG